MSTSNINAEIPMISLIRVVLRSHDLEMLKAAGAKLGKLEKRTMSSILNCIKEFAAGYPDPDATVDAMFNPIGREVLTVDYSKKQG